MNISAHIMGIKNLVFIPTLAFINFKPSKHKHTTIMGKGDKKTKRGKITMGTFGVRRPRKKTKPFVVVKKKATTTAKATEDNPKTATKAKPKAAVKTKATTKAKP